MNVKRFKQIDQNKILAKVELAAGTIYHDNFLPDWPYVFSTKASTEAVIAALWFGEPGEQEWEMAIKIHCPRARALMEEHYISFTAISKQMGNEQILAQIIGLINEELGGYELLRHTPSSVYLDAIASALDIDPEDINFT